MSYDFSNLKSKLKETEEWLVRELGAVRTGRANPSMLDSIKVDAYGSEMGISQVASISLEDSRTLRVTPWDTSLIKMIEKAIIVSNTGLSVATDEKGLRVIVPALTTESRTQFVKLAKSKVEDAKVAVRLERNKVNDDLQSQKKEGAMSEDDAMRAKNEVEKIIKETIDSLDVLGDKKEAEILG